MGSWETKGIPQVPKQRELKIKSIGSIRSVLLWVFWSTGFKSARFIIPLELKTYLLHSRFHISWFLNDKKHILCIHLLMKTSLSSSLQVQHIHKKQVTKLEDTTSGSWSLIKYFIFIWNHECYLNCTTFNNWIKEFKKSL